ncbi:MAG TPA: T9SS type A sorting domain-containing protein [Flavobacteriales bacterium]|nr:T9SS type A sorting domain-containing protein [Flavobacteriales bacterium]
MSTRSIEMKARYASLVLATALATMAQAQLVNLTDEGGNTVNNTTMVLFGSVDDVELSANITATKNGNTSANVNVRRYEITVVPSTQNFFCWGVCYDYFNAGDYPLFPGTSDAILHMEPGQSLSNFHGYHRSAGHTGVSTYRYVWFNIANPTDTAWVDLQFVITPVGVEEITAVQPKLDVFPTPAIAQDVQVDYVLDRSTAGAKLVVYTMLGETMGKPMNIGSQGRVILRTAEWTSGIYFANIERDGRIIASRRIVIAR